VIIVQNIAKFQLMHAFAASDAIVALKSSLPRIQCMVRHVTILEVRSAAVEDTQKAVTELGMKWGGRIVKLWVNQTAVCILQGRRAPQSSNTADVFIVFVRRAMYMNKYGVIHFLEEKTNRYNSNVNTVVQSYSVITS
jgi:hypothetical protein